MICIIVFSLLFRNNLFWYLLVLSGIKLQTGWQAVPMELHWLWLCWAALPCGLPCLVSVSFLGNRKNKVEPCLPQPEWLDCTCLCLSQTVPPMIFFSKTAFVHSLWLPRRRESLSTGYKSSIRPAGQTVFCVCRDVNQIDGCATSSWGRAGGVHFLSDGCRARRGQAWCRSPWNLYLSCGLGQCLLRLCLSLLCCPNNPSFTSSIKWKDNARLSFYHPCTSHWCSVDVLPLHLLFQFPLVGIFILFCSSILYTAWDTLWKCCIQFLCLVDNIFPIK